MIVLLATILTACAPVPASIKFDGEATVTVHTLEGVNINKATVLDAEGKALDPQPTMVWSVTPATVATLAGTTVTAVADGEATVEAKVGEIKGAYKFVVALPNAIEIAGYDANKGWAVGGEATFTANVKAGEAVVAGQAVAWSTSDAAIATVDAATGVVKGIAAGTAAITATSGALTAVANVIIGGADIVATVDAGAPAADAAAAPAAH